MASPMPEWAGEEIVEDVEEVLGGKKQELPPDRMRHRGRIPPPKKNTRNSVSPKAVVDIQTFECQAIEDDLVTDSLSAPSPLNLEIASSRPTPRAQHANNSNSGNGSAASPPNKALNSVRVSPDSPRGCGPDARNASSGANVNTQNNNNNNNNTSSNHNSANNRPRPPPTRAPGQLSVNPRAVAATTNANNANTAVATATTTANSKLISGTPNRLSPMNDGDEVGSGGGGGGASNNVRRQTARPSDIHNNNSNSGSAARPSPPTNTAGFRRSNNTKSSPSLGSLDDGTSDLTTPTDSNSRKAALPFSAPAGQTIPALRRDISAPTSGQASRGMGPAVRKANSAEVQAVAVATKSTAPAPPATTKSAAPAASPGTTSTSAAPTAAPVKPSLLAPATGSGGAGGRGGAAPVPATRSRTVPRAMPHPTAALAAGEAKLNATAPPSTEAATGTTTQANPPNSTPNNNTNDRGRLAGSPTLPRVGPLSATTRSTTNNNKSLTDDFGDGDYPEYDLSFPTHTIGVGANAGGPVVSEHEPRAARQNARNPNTSMMSSAGYSVLRGAYDSYANLDSTLPSVAGLNATQASVTNASRVGSARPPNMMVGNSATALRAKSSFARASSLRRRPQGAEGTTAGAVEAILAVAGGAPASQSSANQREAAGVKPSPKPASRVMAATVPDKSPSPDEKANSGDHSEHDNHRKRVPQTKRELRRRSTEFDKV